MFGWKDVWQNICERFGKFKSNPLVLCYFVIFVAFLSYLGFWRALLAFISENSGCLRYDVLMTSNFTIPALLIGQIVLVIVKPSESKEQLSSSSTSFSILLVFFCILAIILALITENLFAQIGIFLFNLFMWIMSNSTSKDFDLSPSGAIVGPKNQFEIKAGEDTAGLQL